MNTPPDVVFHVLQAGLALATLLVVVLLFALFYQVAIKPDLQKWRRNREAKARRTAQVQTA